MFEKFPLFRFLVWLLASVVLLACLTVISPVQLPVVLYKLVLVVLAVTLAYLLDRLMFPYARPHILFDRADELDKVFATVATLRRALIITACVLGLTLGL
ncbi:putative holin [Neptuniibacter marinus]|uniref:putative holin n=1 Tax=Neptuniibacter marinus TaxID=1806670 RepID=UPI003B593299